MKKKLLASVTAAVFTLMSTAQAQSLPTYDLLGAVTGNTPNTWQTYNFSFTPTTSGANYIGFAFRQDPAFWSFDNVRLFAPNSTVNLVTNGDMTDGGTINITTSNGPGSINAPTNWGVWYQNGTYPAAAGTWMNGLWYDGAVGTFDGIYQGISLTAGTLYTLYFDVSGNHTSDGSSVQLGAYAGVCSNASLAANQCTIPSAGGFTTLATPEQGAAATSNPTPTVVNTVQGTPRLISVSNPILGTTVIGAILSTTYGTPNVTTSYDNARGTQGARLLNIVRTRTDVTETPVTVVRGTTTPTTLVRTYQPTVVDTYTDQSTQTRDDGNTYTETVDGTPVSGTLTAQSIDTQTQQSSQTYTTRIDQYDYMSKANTRINMTLDSNILDRHDGKDNVLASRTGLLGDEEKGWTWAIAEGQRSNTSDTYRMNTTRFGLGHEKKIQSNWIVGAQYNNVLANLSGDQSGGRLEKNHVGLYSLYNIDGWLLKSDLGVARNTYSNYHSINELGMSNTGKTNGTDVWLANRLYAPSMEGFRPFAGVRVQNSTIGGLTESGTPLTAMTYAGQNQTQTIGEAGVRYDRKVADAVNLTAEAGQTSNNITTIKAGASFTPEKNVLGGINLVQQRQGGVVNNMVQAMVKWLF